MNRDDEDYLRLFALSALGLILMLAWGAVARGDEPPVAYSDDPPAAWQPLPQPDTFRATDGLLYEKHADGYYRLVPGQTTVPGVTAPARPFPVRRDDHACPSCGRLQFRVDSFNRNGTHNHRCPVDGTVWSH
jgi:hypothetical protein